MQAEVWLRRVSEQEDADYLRRWDRTYSEQELAELMDAELAEDAAHASDYTMRAAEAAAYLGVSPKRVRELVLQGRLRGQVRNSWYYLDERSVVAFAQVREHDAQRDRLREQVA